MRFSDPKPAELLRELLADRYLASEVAPANVGIIVGESDGRVYEKHTFLRSNQQVFRSASLSRALRAVLGVFSEFERDTPPPGHVDLAVTPVLTPHGAWLVDRSAAHLIDGAFPELSRLGFTVVGTGVVRVDTATGLVDLRLPHSWQKAATDLVVASDRSDRSAAFAPSLPTQVRGLLINQVRLGIPRGAEYSERAAVVSLVTGSIPSDQTLASLCEVFVGRVSRIWGVDGALAAQLTS